MQQPDTTQNPPSTGRGSGSRHRADIPATEDIFGTEETVFDRLTKQEQPTKEKSSKQKTDVSTTQSDTQVTKAKPEKKKKVTIPEQTVSSEEQQNLPLGKLSGKMSVYLTPAEKAKLKGLARELRRATGDEINDNDVIRRLIHQATPQSLLQNEV